MRKYPDSLLRVKHVLKFEMLMTASSIECLTDYLINLTLSSISLHSNSLLIRSQNEEDKRLNEEHIRCGLDLKCIYIYATHSIQT
ncbi:unnamed protein product [Rotaria sp. Silwood2]|nr:unnamed protein product [Rotaria sp. Silwood2]CAF4068309.1 unnamed protein product [Rotaria sp. Silwood2]